MSDMTSTIYIHTIFLNGACENIHINQNVGTDLNTDQIICIC